uniref:Uncharacterized protein n=1 Tax=Ixodes ricinus TaxID=34613 RepID=A0A6B0U973_IXORI
MCLKPMANADLTDKKSQVVHDFALFSIAFSFILYFLNNQRAYIKLVSQKTVPNLFSTSLTPTAVPAYLHQKAKQFYVYVSNRPFSKL